MNKIKVSIVNYSNNLPVGNDLYNFNNNEFDTEIKFENYSDCFLNFINGNIDIGLAPLTLVPKLKVSYIAAKYCIGVIGSSDILSLCSNVPLKQITGINFSFSDETANALTQILAANYWNILPEWFYESNTSETTAYIYSKYNDTFPNKKFKYTYDLTNEWYNYTGSPFVLAIWLAIKPLNRSFLDNFSNHLYNLYSPYLSVNTNQTASESKFIFQLTPEISASMKNFLFQYRQINADLIKSRF